MQISSVTDVTSLMKTAESAFEVVAKTAKTAINAEQTAGGIVTDLINTTTDIAKDLPIIGGIIDLIA